MIDGFVVIYKLVAKDQFNLAIESPVKIELIYMQLAQGSRNYFVFINRNFIRILIN